MMFRKGPLFTTVCVTARGAMAAALLLAAVPTAWAESPALQPIAKTLLQATTTGDGEPLVYPPGQALITARLVEVPPGVKIATHRHPMPLFVYILDGELTITGDGMPARRFKAGDAFMEVAAWHQGQNNGDVPVRLLSVYSGAEGLPLSEKPH